MHRLFLRGSLVLMRWWDHPFASIYRHMSGPLIVFKRLRPGFVRSNPVPALLFQDLEHAADGLANIVLKLIDRFALRVAAWERRNLSPKTAVRIFMDDDGEILHISILSRSAHTISTQN